MPGALDCSGQFALVFGAGSCLSARADFSIFGDETFQLLSLFIFDFDVFVGAELAKTRAGIIAPPHPGSRFVSTLSVVHNMKLLLECNSLEHMSTMIYARLEG